MSYHSPHKFRHGSAVYAIRMAKNIAALKAVSQNLTHSNLNITDGIYGILSKLDVREQIIGLGQTKGLINGKEDEIVSQLKRILLQLENRDK